MRRLSRFPRQHSIALPKDAEGYVGRECPNPECKHYFKITPGTGIAEPAPCHCPYCGYSADQGEFTTRAQIEYATSLVGRQVLDATVKDLQDIFSRPIRGPLGLKITAKVEGRPEPVRHYSEKNLETEVVCDRCGLRYAIYGVFAFCPDCGVHNSLQILVKNLELVKKQLDLVKKAEPELQEHLLVDALENAVSAFDAFGRETCRAHAALCSVPEKSLNIYFQNLDGARQRVQEVFGIDLAESVEPKEWELAHRCFQKRHLFAHRMGVIDRAYLEATRDPTAVLGRKIRTDQDEVLVLIGVLDKIGEGFVEKLSRRPNQSS